MVTSAPPRDAGYVTDLRSLPAGTLQVRVERVVDNSHRRGGQRTALGRSTPDLLLSFLQQQKPGRFRLSCLGAKSRFLKGGSCVVEIASGERIPTIVPARRPRDYGKSPSPTAALKKQTRRGQRKLLELAQKLEGSEQARAALELKNLNMEKTLLVLLQRQQEKTEALGKRLRLAERKQEKTEARREKDRTEQTLALTALKAGAQAERSAREAAEARLAELEAKVSRLLRRVKTLGSAQNAQPAIVPPPPAIPEAPVATTPPAPPAPFSVLRWLSGVQLMIPRNVGGRPKPTEEEPKPGQLTRFLRGAKRSP